MTTPDPTDRERLRKLADQIGCFTEDEFLLLSGYSAKTAAAYRNRRKGPDFIPAGKNTYLYPKKAVAEYMAARVKKCSTPSNVGDLL